MTYLEGAWKAVENRAPAATPGKNDTLCGPARPIVPKNDDELFLVVLTLQLLNLSEVPPRCLQGQKLEAFYYIYAETNGGGGGYRSIHDIHG